MSDIQRIFVLGLLASATCRTLPIGFSVRYVDHCLSQDYGNYKILTCPFAPYYPPFGSEKLPIIWIITRLLEQTTIYERHTLNHDRRDLKVARKSAPLFFVSYSIENER